LYCQQLNKWTLLYTKPNTFITDIYATSGYNNKSDARYGLAHNLTDSPQSQSMRSFRGDKNTL